MSDGGDTRNISRQQEIVLAVICVIVLTILAATLSSANGSLTAPPDVSEPGSVSNLSQEFYPALVGGGSVGNARRNPIGVGVNNSSNPFQNRSAELLFTVQTTDPGYWRVDAYSTYQNGTWVRTGAHTRYVDGVSPSGPFTRFTQQRVSLAQRAIALPGVWQPGQIRNQTIRNVSVSPETGLHVADPVAATTNYTLVSYRYDPDISRLRNTQGDYPPIIIRRYTQLPASVPQRVINQSDTITAPADTPYESAKLIEQWLEQNKNYSLNSTHAPGTSPVDAFLFSMSAGNSEYFASSMVVLLRAQGIPARYVTGYATGATVPNQTSTYAVRRIHAHAWVEVYFPGHGWVPFDPTPAGPRLQLSDDVIDRNNATVYAPFPTEANITVPEFRLPPDPPTTPTEIATPTPTATPTDIDTPTGTDTPSDGTPTGTDTPSDGTPTGTDTPSDPGPVEISLSDDQLTPGENVTVTVTRSGRPVVGATVLFNGSPIGSTNSTGQVRGVVPYTQSLNITVTNVSQASIGVQHIAFSGASSYSVQAIFNSEFNTTIREVQEGNGNNTTVTVPLSTSTSLTAEPLPLVIGGEASIQALISGQPFPGATVLINGRRVGTTGQAGIARITIPNDTAPGAVTLTVRRGEISASRTFPAGVLRVDTPPTLFLGLPGQEVNLTVTVGKIPVAGASVQQGGTRLGDTNQNGTISATLPLWPFQQVVVTYAGTQTTATVSNQLLPAIVVTIGGLGVMFLFSIVIERQTGIGNTTQRRISGLSGALLALTVRTGEEAGRLLNQVGNGLRQVPPALIAFIQSPVATIVYVWNQRPDSILRWTINRLISVWATVRGIPPAILGILRRGFEPRADTNVDDDNRTVVDAPSSTSAQTIRDVWVTFVRLVFRRLDTTKTPTELADAAIQRGLPEQPVRRLTEAFQEAEYGPHAVSEPDEEVATALSQIEDVAGSADDDAELTQTERSQGDDS